MKCWLVNGVDLILASHWWSQLGSCLHWRGALSVGPHWGFVPDRAPWLSPVLGSLPFLEQPSIFSLWLCSLAPSTILMSDPACTCCQELWSMYILLCLFMYSVFIHLFRLMPRFCIEICQLPWDSPGDFLAHFLMGRELGLWLPPLPGCFLTSCCLFSPIWSSSPPCYFPVKSHFWLSWLGHNIHALIWCAKMAALITVSHLNSSGSGDSTPKHNAHQGKSHKGIVEVQPLVSRPIQPPASWAAVLKKAMAAGTLAPWMTQTWCRLTVWSWEFHTLKRKAKTRQDKDLSSHVVWQAKIYKGNKYLSSSHQVF